MTYYLEQKQSKNKINIIKLNKIVERLVICNKRFKNEDNRLLEETIILKFTESKKQPKNMIINLEFKKGFNYQQKRIQTNRRTKMEINN